MQLFNADFTSPLFCVTGSPMRIDARQVKAAEHWQQYTNDKEAPGPRAAAGAWRLGLALDLS